MINILVMCVAMLPLYALPPLGFSSRRGVDSQAMSSYASHSLQYLSLSSAHTHPHCQYPSTTLYTVSIVYTSNVVTSHDALQRGGVNCAAETGTVDKPVVNEYIYTVGETHRRVYNQKNNITINS